MTYTRNAVRGQWGAHGRYLDREAARCSRSASFNERGESTETARQLSAWQKVGDPQIWKLIISPEFGERIDLRKLTAELMRRIEVDRGGANLEWVAAAHYNTEHPHVHVALRGVDGAGEAVRFGRDFIKQGIRELAANLCTQQIGYRSEFDAAAARNREVSQQRFTSLDRVIGRSASADKDLRSFTLCLPYRELVQRLVVLQGMGLAEPINANTWRVRRDFEGVLRAMQKVADRQRTLAAHGIPLSDARLPIEAVDGREWKQLEGRVLVHGQDEDNPESPGYLMLESTAGRVHYISYTPELEELRSRGQLRPNHFVRLRRRILSGRSWIEPDDLGSATEILRNKRYLRQAAREFLKHGHVPEDVGWGGWLGQYHAALRQAAIEVEQIRCAAKQPGRDVSTSRGR